MLHWTPPQNSAKWGGGIYIKKYGTNALSLRPGMAPIFDVGMFPGKERRNQLQANSTCDVGNPRGTETFGSELTLGR